MNKLVTILLIGVAATGAQQQSGFKCSHEFGFYPHEVACDKYWACDNNVATLKTCGNGLAFDNSDVDFLTESCDYIYNVDCSTRPERQPAIPSLNCPYQYGIFADEKDCTVFWSCWGGEASRYQCGPGLAYTIKSRICTWMDEVPGCNKQRAESVQGFVCPAAGELVAISSFTRHAHPEDCRQYYVCLDGVAREYGCPIGTTFAIGAQEGLGECTDPKNVPGCENYYGDFDLDVLQKSKLLLGTLGLGTSAPRTVTEQPAQRSAPAIRPRKVRPNTIQDQPEEVLLEDVPLN